jgi:predicted aminopeptidase
VKEFDGEALEFVLAEFEEDGFGGSSVVFGLAFDAGANNVGLATAADLLAEKVPDFAEFFRVVDAGSNNFLAAWREIADDGDFEIAELCEAKAAGDGSGGHDENMWAGAIC